MYKQLYEEGKQRRNQVNAKYAPTITIITAETGAILWIIFKIISNIEEYNSVIKIQHLFPIIFTTITAIIWITAIIFLIICLTNYNFVYILIQIRYILVSKTTKHIYNIMKQTK